MIVGLDQVRPRLVVLANQVGWAPFRFRSWRSQTTYAARGLAGSAVTASLSSTKAAWVSPMTVTGLCQLLPPSKDVLTRTPLAGFTASNTSEAAYRVRPSEENDSHGSEASW